MSSASFESARVWNDARRLTARVYALTREGPIGADSLFREQLRYAAIALTARIAESCERTGSKDFMQLVAIAKASCIELRSHFYIAEDLGYIDAQRAAALRSASAALARQIQALVRARAEQRSAGFYPPSLPA